MAISINDNILCRPNYWKHNTALTEKEFSFRTFQVIILRRQEF